MTENKESKVDPSMFNDEYMLEWMEEHLADLKHSVAGQRILYRSLVISIVVGLAAHVGGYFLLESAPSGFLGLLADLLHALGWSLWTGAVVAVFVQIIPEVKRRQISQMVAAYETWRDEKAQAAGKGDGAIVEGPHAGRAKRGQAEKQPRNRTRKGG
jgi:hypothetical protein